jgi:hypothetical protein
MLHAQREAANTNSIAFALNGPVLESSILRDQNANHFTTDAVNILRVPDRIQIIKF